MSGSGRERPPDEGQHSAQRRRLLERTNVRDSGLLLRPSPNSQAESARPLQRAATEAPNQPRHFVHTANRRARENRAEPIIASRK